MAHVIRLSPTAVSSVQAAVRIAAVVAMAAALSTPVRAGPSRTETASLPHGAKSSEGIGLPAILSPADVSTYRTIFQEQTAADWAGADKDLKYLRDGRLIGHVFAQRYLDPRYSPRYEELAVWLRQYPDLPEADAIYKEALARHAKGTKPPRPPGSFVTIDAVAEKGAARRPTVPARGKNDANGDGPAAMDLADQEPVLDDTSASFFFSGQHQDALNLAESAAKGSGDRADSAHWTAGLSAWRLGLMERAAEHFGSLAASSSASAWSRAAGAYWTARAYQAAGNAEKAASWLRVASKYSRTFYGLLAQKSLGLPSAFDWTAPTLSEAELNALAAQPAGGRAFALLQIGERALADRELRHVRADDPAAARTLMAVALKAELPALAMVAGRIVAKADGQHVDSALYPIPAWQPAGGYHVDKALLFALIRHESEFKTTASSPAGALGLMQLMPSTASYVAQDDSLKGKGKARLYQPEFNISLGQRYVAYLLEHDAVRGDLFSMIAAYNGGPGKLAKWQRVTDHGDDPLLFVESIPSRETRVFVQKVLASYWIYSARLGQAVPSLEAIAAGEWPSYTSQDGKTAAKNARH
ncbi:MAG: transglycosylase SLT domain-containing protein [Alphaproteobacteria bacterium]